jgi:quercetin dioxygenase-like cupin family protein
VDLRTPPEIAHTTPKDRAPYQIWMGELSVEPLFPFQAGPEVSLFLLQVPVGEKDTSFLRAAAGEVFLYNMKGILEITMDADRHILKEGDSIHFVVKGEPAIENIGESPAKVFASVSPRMSV